MVLAALLLSLLSQVAVSSAQHVSGHYELCELTYTIRPDRTLQAEENITFVNTSLTQVKITVNKTIPSPDVENVWVRDALGDLTYQLTKGTKSTSISFETRWIGQGQHYTYGISYTADGLVTGSDSEYKATLGGLQAGGYRYDNYVVIVQGPSGTRLFLTNPQADVIENNPPKVRYQTSIDASGSFDGLQVRFFEHPVYYKHTLIESISNPSTEASRDIKFDTILFSPSLSQFAAFLDSNLPMSTMYVDGENNWHAVFDVGSIQPMASKELRIEIVSANDVYTPGITENDVGTLTDVPAALSPYTKADNYWEVDNLTIRQQAALVVGGETNAYRVAEKIVEYVDEHVTYEVTAKRQGAARTFDTARGDCDGFSDLTIALSRAVGLPARANFGWGFQENTVGHAWVEFYLPGEGWQPADPTWAKTSGDYMFKLDPIHLLRSVRGVSSSEVYTNYTWYGSQPTAGEERDNLVVLREGEAENAFVQAGTSAITIAGNLLASQPNATLSQELQLAQAKLAQAQAASGASAIALAQDAIQHANVVIQALGKKPETGSAFPIEPFQILLIAAVIIVLAVMGGAVSWARSRRS